MVEGRAAMLDLDLRQIASLAPDEKRYTPIRRYPSSAFDLSVIAGARELAGDLRAKLAGFAGAMLRIHRVRPRVLRSAIRRRAARASRSG